MRLADAAIPYTLKPDKHKSVVTHALLRRASGLMLHFNFHSLDDAVAATIQLLQFSSTVCWLPLSRTINHLTQSQSPRTILSNKCVERVRNTRNQPFLRRCSCSIADTGPFKHKRQCTNRRTTGAVRAAAIIIHPSQVMDQLQRQPLPRHTITRLHSHSGKTAGIGPLRMQRRGSLPLLCVTRLKSGPDTRARRLSL